jgi:hypothetical protein
MAQAPPLLGYDQQDDELFGAPVRGANLPPEHAQGNYPPPPYSSPSHSVPPPASKLVNPFGFSDEDVELVELVLDEVTFKLQVVKAQVDDTAVALFYDSGRCDIILPPGRKLTVISRDQQLQVVYAGGKVAFGQYSLLSFIRGVQPS